MLEELQIRNFALIDSLRLELGPGLTVLTGETGAGKSIIIDAVNLLVGGRAQAESIRQGEDMAVIEGVFDISDAPLIRNVLSGMGIELAEGDPLIITREIYRSGRNRCRVNSATVTLGNLAALGACLIDIHGQHEHQSLLRTSSHLDLLDSFGGEEILAQRGAVSAAYRELMKLLRELDELKSASRERSNRLDMIAFQLNEIDSANLVFGEDETLMRERAILSSAEKLFEAASRAYSALYEGQDSAGTAVDRIGEALAALDPIVGVDPRLESIADTLRSALAEVEEASRALRVYRDSIESDPERLAEVEERLALLARLKRKYGPELSDVLAYRESIAQERSRLENWEERIARLEQEIETCRRRLGELAGKLSEARRALAAALGERITRELHDLAMPHAVFQVYFAQEESPDGVPYGGRRLAVTERGLDTAEFLFSANPGEPPRKLTRIASGGELSRVMLAVKSVLAACDDIPTLIFDEIDAGIGGRAASSVAQKLRALGGLRQVICVTHLPQIAGAGHHHLAITKLVEGGRTRTTVTRLLGRERLLELARMIGGDNVTETTLAAADEAIMK